MALINQLFYKVLDPTSGKLMSTPDWDPMKVTNLTGAPITKIGVQAPPGTRFYLNANDQNSGTLITIGRSGMFELDDPHIEISTIRFEQVFQAQKNEKATQTALKNGLSIMQDALNGSDADKIKTASTDKLENQTVVNNVSDAAEQVLLKFTNGFNEFRRGVYGIWEDSDKPVDLRNIIVDWIGGSNS